MSRNSRTVTNPFGDDDDDDGDDNGFNNPFAAKAKKRAAAATTNPFGEVRTSTTAGTKNDGGGGADDVAFDARGTMKTATSTTTTNSNPFGGDSPERKRTNATTTNNDDDESNDDGNNNHNHNPFEDGNSPSRVTKREPRTHNRHMTAPVIPSTAAPVDPFESHSRGRTNGSHDDKRGTSSKRSTTGNSISNGSSANGSSLEFDADFDRNGGTTKNKHKKSTPAKKSFFGGGGGSSNDSALEPIVAKMDDPNPNPKGTPTTTTSSPRKRHGRARSEAASYGGGSNTTNDDPRHAGNENSLASWLRGNKAADENEVESGGAGTMGGGGGGASSIVGGKDGRKDSEPKHRRKVKIKDQDHVKERSSRGGGTKKKKKKTLVQPWPYDDYHQEQEKYYEKLSERGSTPKKDRRGNPMDYPSELDGYHSGSDVDDKTSDRRRNEFDDGNKFYERPEELDGIKEAVQNLSLLEFEKKAEDRAISIVSTWLFDTGVIDELLINGGNGRSKSNNSNLSTSGLSNEGIEVGAHGFPIEGGLKVDNEIEKLRASAQRELTLVNSRLNDGVAASGSEVKDLVAAVSATKNDLGRLRELTTYISSGYKKDDGMIFAEFPRLKRSINARSNIHRCFRELEFFAHIPTTCERLREELYEGDYTDEEWNKIRDVCMEHVELEILLVEAESGMKDWLDNEGEGDFDDDASFRSLRSNRSLIKSWRVNHSAVDSHYEIVDKFLSQHVKNVWELGEEINIKILSGVGNAFEISLKNPAGMVALVEAVEVYERAAEQYNKVHRGEESALNSRNRLNFTDMRASALDRLYQDFELRGLDVFRAVHMQAADLAEEEDAQKSQFNAVLRGATELVAEIDIVKNQMAPCFAPHWHIEMMWSSCVAHVCANQIIQQIGGPDGQNLPDLTVTQLLDLVAWVEFFRQTIEDAFPSIATKKEKKTYFDERPDLFSGDKKALNLENATDSLAWVNNMLWEVHRLAQDEFLLRTRSQTDELLGNIYKENHETHQTSEGRLMTSLCEDIFALATIQLRTIRERLTKKSEALVMAVCLIFSQLRAKQLTTRDIFLQDLESCCASANDFQRMAEQSEDLLQDLLENCEMPEDSIRLLEESCNTLVSLYSADAVFAAQRAHTYIFEEIENVGIAADLFGPEWEKDLTNSELAWKLTRTLEDFILDLETWLDDFMLKKTVDALVTSTTIFYLKYLLLKAESHNNKRNSFFSDNSLACERMFRDSNVIKDYFEGLVEGMPSLKKHIEKEFEVLTTVQELLRIAAGLTESDPSDFIIVLHKRVRDVNITKHLVGDLWHLVQPTEERNVWELTESLEETLEAVCPSDVGAGANDTRMNVPGLRLDETLAKLYIDSTRKRPVHAGNVEKMVTALKNNWKPEES